MLKTAHRGDSRRHLHNSPGAVSSAIDLGADVVEVDVRASSDGGLYCAHYPWVFANFLTPAFGARRYDRSLALSWGRVSGRSSRRLNSLGFAKLSDIFGLAHGQVKVLCDLKDKTPEFALRVIEVARDSGIADEDLFIGVRTLEQLKAVKERYQNVPVVGFLSLKELDAFQNGGGNIFRLWEGEALDSEIVDGIKDKGIPVWVTAGFQLRPGFGSRRSLGRIIDVGAPVEGILANDPRLLVDLLGPGRG